MKKFYNDSRKLLLLGDGHLVSKIPIIPILTSLACDLSLNLILLLSIRDLKKIISYKSKQSSLNKGTQDTIILQFYNFTFATTTRSLQIY